ncbi:MAG: serine hydrolase [Candidatus Latescibacterota bacterium]|nr:MAG: serine hydrolase [Candidatus Latescibacterota bacterium]
MAVSIQSTRIFAFLAICLLFHPAAAADQPTIAGHWQGTINIPNMELEILIDFAQDDQGEWTGTIDIPAQGARGLALKDISFDGSKATFKITGPPGDPTFNGTLSDDGTEITGDFAQSGGSFPFTLTRAGDTRLSDVGPSSEDAIKAIDEFLTKSLDTWNVPGAGIAVIKDGEPILVKGYGYRDIDKKLPVTEDTQFAIGSASKAFTTLILGMLAQEGTIDWDEPVRTYLPTFELEDRFASERMTTRDLVCHRSGLPRHDLMWYGSSMSREELVSRLVYLQPNKDFRTEFQYQNLMFLTAGYLAGQVTGTSWDYLVTHRIFEPLEMNNSNTSVDDLQRAPEHAIGYQEKDDDESDVKKIEVMPYRNIDNMAPAGSINSSAADMARWVQLQLGQGTIDGKQIVAAPTIQELHRPHIVVSGGMITQLFTQPEMPHIMYGLGWFVQPYRGHEMIHHGGNIDGFSALVGFMPKDNVGAVILTNLNGTPFPTVAMLGIFDRLLGLETIEWNDRYQTIWAQLEQAQDQAKTLEDINRKKNTKTSHPLDDYAGTYTHPAYGSLAVSKDGKKLTGAYNGMSYPLEHWHYDVFETTGYRFEGIKLAFLTNLNGDIDRLSVALEQTVDAIVFKKEPPKEMFERDFLEQFVGEYDLMGMTVTATVRDDNVLIMTVPGQPVFELEPYMTTEFRLKGYDDYSVKFVIEKGEVKRAVFIQPNGVFPADRKK